MHHSYYSTREFLIEGLTVLKNRGYDSAGLVTMANELGSPLVSHVCLYHGIINLFVFFLMKKNIYSLF